MKHKEQENKEYNSTGHSRDTNSIYQLPNSIHTK